MPDGQRRLEFWPDCDGALLHENGTAVPLVGLPLPADVVGPATSWLAAYADDKLDPDRPDEAWISEGRALFVTLRDLLAPHGIAVFDWEGVWGPQA